jgi:hypothetical protein
MVKDEYAVVARELGHLMAPVRNIAGVAVDEHDGIALIAVKLEVQLYSVDDGMRHVSTSRKRLIHPLDHKLWER